MEVMDDPGLDAARHRHALRGLRTVNRFSNSAGLIWSQIDRYARAAGTVSLLDIASGGGDVAIGVWQRAKRAGMKIRVGSSEAGGSRAGTRAGGSLRW